MSQMVNEPMCQMVNESMNKFCHWSFVIGHWSFVIRHLWLLESVHLN